jgi:ATP-binding cassette, subfamily G (WHITE), member 2, SNQ2
VTFSLFNGVVRTYAQLPAFWRSWTYYFNPSTYWIGGVLAATLPGVHVTCSSHEMATFRAPPGQSCEEDATSFVEQVGMGYLTTLGGVAGGGAGGASGSEPVCGFCLFCNGTESLSTLNIHPDQKWRDLGISCAFFVSNWALVYFFIYTVRVKGWTFGLGWLFGLFGRVVDAVVAVIRRFVGREGSRKRGAGE